MEFDLIMVAKKQIKNLLSLGFLFLFLFSVSCKSKKDIVASIEIEGKLVNVSREVLGWLSRLQMGPDGNKPTLEAQQQILKSYLLSQMVENETKQAKLEETSDYKSNSFFLEEKASIAAFELALREENKDLKFDFIDTQWVILEKTNPSPSLDKEKKDKATAEKKTAQDRTKDADEIIAKLNAIPEKEEAKIEEQIFNVSENPRYKLQAGYLDPICLSCATNPIAEYSEQIENAPLNKFIKIETPNAIWIIRPLKKYNLKSSEIQSRIESHLRKVARVARTLSAKLVKSDPAQAFVNEVILSQDKIEAQAKERSKWLIQKEKESYFYSYIYRLKKQNKLVFEETAKMKPELEKMKLSSFKKEMVLYTLNQSEKFTYGDLLKKIEPYAKDSFDTPVKQMAIVHNLLMPYALLSKDKDFQKSKASALFPFVKKYIHQRLLTMAYFKAEREKVEVGSSEIKKQYEAEKVARFQSKPLSKELEKAIKDEIIQKKFGDWFNKQQESMATKYKLNIKVNMLLR